MKGQKAMRKGGGFLSEKLRAFLSFLLRVFNHGFSRDFKSVEGIFEKVS